MQAGSKRPNLPASVVFKVSCEHFSQPLLEARPTNTNTPPASLLHPALSARAFARCHSTLELRLEVHRIISRGVLKDL